MLTKRISRRGLAGLCVIGTLCASTGTTPSAADACTGVPIRPGMSIPNTVDGAPAGTTFCISPGLYRVGRTIAPKAGDSLIAPQGGVTFNGARMITSWRQSGTVWVASGRTQAPTVNFGGWGDPTMKYPQARYSDDVFIDGNMLWKVGVRINGHIYGETAGTVGRGEYFVNYDKNTITLGSNPRGHLVEQAFTPGGIDSAANDVTVSGLTVQQMAGDGIDARGQRWHITGNVVRMNHVTGINLGDNAVVQDNVVNKNGQYGIAGPSHGALVDGNTVAYNNAARFSTSDGRCSGAGGSKFAATTDLMVSNNIYHDNYCNGIWIDVASNNVTLDGNQSYRNTADGIREEVSYNLTVHGNNVHDNGRGGIAILDSPNTEISDNTVSGNAGYQIILHQHHRTDPVSPLGPHELRNASVTGNQIYLGTSKIVGAFNSDSPKQMDLFTSWNTVWSGNTYHVATAGQRSFAWMSQRLTFAAWQGYGLDTGGSLVVG
jgi:parallel beta-helix repeat protein